MFGGERSRRGVDSCFYPRSPARSMRSTGAEQSPIISAHGWKSVVTHRRSTTPLGEPSVGNSVRRGSAHRGGEARRSAAADGRISSSGPSACMQQDNMRLHTRCVFACLPRSPSTPLAPASDSRWRPSRSACALTRNNEVTFRWDSGHSGVAGNEVADGYIRKECDHGRGPSGGVT